MSSVNQVRSTFLDFFAKNGHEVVPSSPLVPRNDPTLMFTSAGMVQFKNVFTGQETRSYTRATTAQKCVRAGGKHNDLDNVGYTNRHHTFFEMLGNFSFGDYFKEPAIPLAWELVTKDFGLDPKRLLVTIYHDDEDAYRTWKKVAGFSDDKIIRIATSDNFWSAGETGPCGPCSEIFLDQGDKVAGGPPGSADQDGDRFLEFWNLVFMQYEQRGPGDRVDLPRPSIDTGMGLERMTAILQGVQSVYDIDLLRALIAASEAATGVPAKGEHQASHRVIADHLRATSFLIAEGVLPSNAGRGYVLRRIMRRAMRHAHLLGAKEPLMWRLVPALVQQMGETYPELVRAQPLITETLKLEETRFRKTLEKGLGLLGEASGTLRKGDVFSGDTAFKLYDTFGFPLDLTQDALKPRGITVDLRGLRCGDAEAEGRGAQGLEGLGRGRHRDRLVRGQGARRRHRLPGLRHASRRGRDPRRPQGRQGGRQPEGRRRGRAGAEPDAVLRRVRRPGRRHRADQGTRRARCSASPTRRRSWATCSCTSAASRRARSSRAMRSSWWSITRAARPRAPTTRPPTSCTRPCARCSASTWPRRARWSRPTGCASTSRTPSPCRPTRSRPWRPWPTPTCCRTRPSRPG